jgi:hypothetical protein
MSKLDTILSQDVSSPFMEKDGYNGVELNVLAAKEAIKDIIRELIGEDETEYASTDTFPAAEVNIAIRNRNSVRIDMRKKVELL